MKKYGGLGTSEFVDSEFIAEPAAEATRSRESATQEAGGQLALRQAHVAGHAEIIAS